MKRPRWWRRVARHRLAAPLAIWLVGIACSYWLGEIKSTPLHLLSWGISLAMILVMWWSVDVYCRMLLKIQKARAALIDERLAMREWNKAQAMKMRRYIYSDDDRDLR